jgi:hypothetical protein
VPALVSHPAGISAFRSIPGHDHTPVPLRGQSEFALTHWVLHWIKVRLQMTGLLEEDCSGLEITCFSRGPEVSGAEIVAPDSFDWPAT